MLVVVIISFQKSKTFSNENITAPTTTDYRLYPQLSHNGTKTRVEFKGACDYEIMR